MRFDRKIVILLLLLMAVPYPAWYLANWYAAGLVSQQLLIEYGMQKEFIYCSKWRPELIDPNVQIRHMNKEYPQLCWAVKNKHHQNMMRLIELGIDPDSADNQKITALHLAVNTNDFKAVKILLNAGASPNVKDNYLRMYPIHWSIIVGNADILKALLNAGADINVMSEYEQNYAIHVATKFQQYELIEILIENNADLTVVDANGHNPLHIAVVAEDLKMINIVLKYKDKSNDKSGFFKGAIHELAIKGDLALIKYFAAHGAPLDGEDDMGISPLIYASDNGRIELVSYLLSKGADINGSDPEGWTALHAAVRANHHDVARVLLENSAEINAIYEEEGNAPQTPRDMFVDNKMFDILDKYGAKTARMLELEKAKQRE